MANNHPNEDDDELADEGPIQLDEDTDWGSSEKSEDELSEDAKGEQEVEDEEKFRELDEGGY